MSGGVAIHTELFSRARCEARRRKEKKRRISLEIMRAGARNCAHRRTRRRLLSPERGVERVDPSIVGLKTRSRVIRETGVYACAFFSPLSSKSHHPLRRRPAIGRTPARRFVAASDAFVRFTSRDACPHARTRIGVRHPGLARLPPAARVSERPRARPAASPRAPPRARRVLPPASSRAGPARSRTLADPRGPPPAAASPASLTAPRSRAASSARGVVRVAPRSRAPRGAPRAGSLARPRSPRAFPRRRRASRARRLGRGTHLRRGGG